MALVTVQRSPSVSSCSSPPSSDSGAGASVDDEDSTRNSRSLSECYFAGKGAALVLPPNERLRPSSNNNSNSNSNRNGNVTSNGNGSNHNRRVSASGSDIQQHLQSMFYLLRPEETLKMAVKLESVHSGRTRYLVVVSCMGRQDAEESCLLGIDCNEKTTVGLVLRVLADTAITLDGDGGFSVSVCGRQHIFKPVSVQAMWSALQTLHKVSSKAREQNYFLGGLTHDWVSYYEQRIESDRSCLNEWHAMDSLESRRPPSPDSVRTKPREREETERVIRCTLKEIMMSVDLDEVTSKYIRGRLEEDLDMDLGEFKPFIDQEMLTILGQMDAATEIFDHVYLGSEWNASNLEELQKNGVHHILNVTREIDNFFPGMFNYLNIRVYDDERTDLLKHWDDTFKYITKARKEGSKVLVHCKMGVSRSASVVIAYAMKAYNWDFKEAFEYVKQKRTCIKPNTSFISQLETYQGILDAMKNREKLQRSKSETNLKSPGLVAKAEQHTVSGASRPLAMQEPVSDPESLPTSQLLRVDWKTTSGEELGKNGRRPKSWSPDNNTTDSLFQGNVAGPTSASLKQLNLDPESPDSQDECSRVACSQTEDESNKLQTCSFAETDPQDAVSPASEGTETSEAARNYNLNVRMPCGNGQAYSVSQNKVVYLPASCCSQESSSVTEVVVPSVKHRVSELELQNSNTNGAASRKISLDRKGLVLNLTTQFESSSSKPGSPNTAEEESEERHIFESAEDEQTAQSQTKLAPQMLTAVLVKKEIWDPGEKESPTVYAVEQVTTVSSSPPSTPISQPMVPSNSDHLVQTSTEVVEKCVHEPLGNKAEDVIFVSELKLGDTETSAPSVRLSKVVAGNRTLPRREGDPFSAQLDRVFEREERKQQRTTAPVISALPPPPPPCITELSHDAPNRECPSRQSSWSSYDSAVVLGFQGEARDAPSRQSSWGSGDTRWTYGGGGTLPSRNSSWGSYDMHPPMQYVNERGEKQQLDDLFGSSSSGMFPYDRDEIPWYPGTVKRTKQKLEEGTGTVKRMCSDAQQRSESPASPTVISQECPSPSPSPSPSPNRAGEPTPGMNVKIHGPRPYRSPSSDRLLPTSGFSFPSSDPHCSDLHSSTMGISFETQNPVMGHYASSPTLCSHHGAGNESEDLMNTSPGSADKIATSQPNITFIDSTTTHERLVGGSMLEQSSAISGSGQADFDREFCPAMTSSTSHALAVCSLSVSAPTTSSISLVEGIKPLTPPSHSLPSVSSACLLPHDLSASVSCESDSEASPCVINTIQCASVKQQKRVLENLTNVTRRCISVDSSADVTKDSNAVSRFPEVVDSQKSGSGLVKNLKKEFEAKYVSKTEKGVTGSAELSTSDNDQKKSSDGLKARSLPSSPVSSHPEYKSPSSPCPSSASTVEDLSVKVLVGKYEVSKNSIGQPDSPPLGGRQRLSENESVPKSTLTPQQQPPIPLRKSSLDIPYIQNNTNKHSSLLVRNLRNGNDGPNARPPMVPHVVRSCVGPSPSVVVASVVAKAASKKQQQGKTHPLARLTINKPRHTNTVYNTM
ncbi:protein phosphatase Slingshot isoform X2 [Periplaneta americana]|uniref:protein phosphatase Slingshot isoform X2 n=1 Tax=Periplaneta americana TaxID=6978 RepID=UPI0037E80356